MQLLSAMILAIVPLDKAPLLDHPPVAVQVTAVQIAATESGSESRPKKAKQEGKNKPSNGATTAPPQSTPPVQVQVPPAQPSVATPTTTAGQQ